MVVWIVITVAVVAGWGGVMGWSVEHVAQVKAEQCQAVNSQMLVDNRQGPLQDCTL